MEAEEQDQAAKIASSYLPMAWLTPRGRGTSRAADERGAEALE